MTPFNSLEDIFLELTRYFELPVNKPVFLFDEYTKIGEEYLKARLSENYSEQDQINMFFYGSLIEDVSEKAIKEISTKDHNMLYQLFLVDEQKRMEHLIDSTEEGYKEIIKNNPYYEKISFETDDEHAFVEVKRFWDGTWNIREGNHNPPIKLEEQFNENFTLEQAYQPLKIAYVVFETLQ
ncbi:MAG: hypothetical protein KC535_02515 [Nanoarchaeota archaeon]|nr:hypothetical protein [Nanoarchaeota archaeon]